MTFPLWKGHFFDGFYVMIVYNINALKIGVKVIQNKEPCIVMSNEYIKPGKGLSFNRIRFKNIVSGKIIERTLKSGESLESANIIEIKLIYLYRNKDFWYFMNEKNFEQIPIHSKILGNSIKWMIEQLTYIITFWNNQPILVTPPDCIHVKIINTNPIIKKALASSGNKLATAVTGAIIKVPVFIQIGDFVKINTHSGTYISRVK